MNTREVFQPTLNCGESALDFVILSECGGPRNCPNSRREFTAYPMRQLLQQKPHRAVRISSPPIADQNRHARLHTGDSMSASSWRILHKAAIDFDGAAFLPPVPDAQS
jgi:hypothetical protein